MFTFSPDAHALYYFAQLLSFSNYLILQHKNFDKGRISWTCVLGAQKNCLIEIIVPGGVAQSVTCLATDASLTADPGVSSLIIALSYTFVEID